MKKTKVRMTGNDRHSKYVDQIRLDVPRAELSLSWTQCCNNGLIATQKISSKSRLVVICTCTGHIGYPLRARFCGWGPRQRVGCPKLGH